MIFLGVWSLAININYRWQFESILDHKNSWTCALFIKHPPPHQNTSYEHVQVNKKTSTQLPQCVQSNIVKHHRVSVATSWFETLHPRMDKDILTNFGEGSKGFFSAGYGRPKTLSCSTSYRSLSFQKFLFLWISSGWNHSFQKVLRTHPQ